MTITHGVLRGSLLAPMLFFPNTLQDARYVLVLQHTPDHVMALRADVKESNLTGDSGFLIRFGDLTIKPSPVELKFWGCQLTLYLPLTFALHIVCVFLRTTNTALHFCIG